ncbi:MAG: hypothetical protein PHF37_10625 [Phycisphaerae bacterium]|nr:hypothetical protein [Phycisphaerae bacterium]
MSDKLLDLDKLIQTEKELVLKGNKFVVPDSLSVIEVVEITEAAQKVQDKPSLIVEQLKVVWKVLSKYNPGKKESDFTENITLAMLGPLMNFIMGVPAQEVTSQAGKAEDSTTLPEVET